MRKQMLWEGKRPRHGSCITRATVEASLKLAFWKVEFLMLKTGKICSVGRHDRWAEQ